MKALIAALPQHGVVLEVLSLQQSCIGAGADAEYHRNVLTATLQRSSALRTPRSMTSRLGPAS
ncbi:hypothetical protein [Amycolatopsis sp. NPDC049868]|uniref:hypothetical protein n=1 Tax=Amycolatopsis sp. NPDC049868 TaxID=3363934 RepID=UPI0037A62AE2